MALDRKSVHVRLSPEQHRQLIVLAELGDKDLAGLASLLLEKAIAGEWLQVQRTAERMKQFGMLRDL